MAGLDADKVVAKIYYRNMGILEILRLDADIVVAKTEGKQAIMIVMKKLHFLNLTCLLG